MDKRLRTAAILFLIVAIGAWWSRHTGWYSKYWFTDVILHLISGAAFANMYLWLAKEKRVSWLTGLNMVAFATFGSVLWEFWEYSGHWILPRVTHFYIPALGDSLGDILCGMIGAALLAVIDFVKFRK